MSGETVPQLRVREWSLVCALALSGPLGAQDADRIWATVHTASGDVHEGFLRWDGNDGSWVDVLDGLKRIPEENYQAWLSGTGEGPAVRTIELRGYRISWNEEHPDFPRTSMSGVRFGHLASLTVTGPNRAELELRSGESVELTGGSSTNLGWGLGTVRVDRPGERAVTLRWSDLQRVDFAAPPDEARATSRRLFGTVQDARGRTYTGPVAWDLDEILESDVLDGEEIRGGRDREIPFGDISTIERTPDGSRVTLRSGRVLELTGTNDVDEGNRGVRISDPSLGTVTVEWDGFAALRLHPPDHVTGYDAFDQGSILSGMLTTRSGEEVHGLIRWDADEASSWELLDGRSDGVAFKFELAFVDRIERGLVSGATITLRDGRSFEVDDSNDVDWDNKGILIAAEDADADPTPAAPAWRLVPWDDFQEVRFGHDASSAQARRPGS